jgi:hypothetical protein
VDDEGGGGWCGRCRDRVDREEDDVEEGAVSMRMGGCGFVRRERSRRDRTGCSCCCEGAFWIGVSGSGPWPGAKDFLVKRGVW